MSQGMESIKWYGTFDTSDVSKFETSLLEWIERNGKNANLVFDDSKLEKISKAIKKDPSSSVIAGIIYVSAPKGTKVMATNKLIIEWHTVANIKSILKSVKKITGEILYEEPQSWEGTTLWYAF